MRLAYIGARPSEAGIVPLPEGWPAADHDEPDPARAKAKVASGKYAPVPAAKAKED